MFDTLLATCYLVVCFFHFNEPEAAPTFALKVVWMPDQLVQITCIWADWGCWYRNCHNTAKGHWWTVWQGGMNMRHSVLCRNRTIVCGWWLTGWIMWPSSSFLLHCQPGDPPFQRHFPRSVPKQNDCPEYTSQLPPKLHFADALSNMCFGRWKNLMIKGTASVFPSELPQSHPHFPLCLSLIFPRLALPLQCFLSDYLHLFPFHSHSLNSSFVLFHFFLVFFPFFLLSVWSLLFLSLLITPVRAKGPIALCMCVCFWMLLPLYACEVCHLYIKIQHCFFPPVISMLSIFLSLYYAFTRPSVSAQWMAASALGWGPPLAAAQCDHSGRAPSLCSQN